MARGGGVVPAGSLRCGNRTQETDAYTRGEGTIGVWFLIRSGRVRGKNPKLSGLVRVLAENAQKNNNKTKRRKRRRRMFPGQTNR